jgi:predicted metal-dependent HD superfamily phosphohydrolase
MRERWHALCERVGAPGIRHINEEELTYEMLVTLYGHPPRAYHNIEHVRHCLKGFDEVRLLAEDRDCVEMALWLHDCVFIPERSDNEACSAETAGVVAGLLGCPAEFTARMRELILVTRHSEAPGRGDPALVADIDLEILSAPEPEYEAYRRAIREEFSFADDVMFRNGRSAFLRRMLEREHIYATAWFREHHEERARENMSRELESLGE